MKFSFLGYKQARESAAFPVSGKLVPPPYKVNQWQTTCRNVVVAVQTTGSMSCEASAARDGAGDGA